jgi:hypothetical protein
MVTSVKKDWSFSVFTFRRKIMCENPPSVCGRHFSTHSFNLP